MIERLDLTHLLKSSNKQYWVGHLDKFGKYLDRIAAYFRASVCRHKLAALVHICAEPASIILIYYLI